MRPGARPAPRAALGGGGTAAVLVIVLTYKKGGRITRDPFEED